jgi:hypothetical protein
MGAVYSQQQCSDPVKKCGYKGPYDSYNISDKKPYFPQEYLDIVNNKTVNELNILYNNTGTGSGDRDGLFLSQYGGQALCNVLGGGKHIYCCDPAQTQLISQKESEGQRMKYTKNANGEIIKVEYCPCKQTDTIQLEQCRNEKCPISQGYQSTFTKYEQCKSAPLDLGILFASPTELSLNQITPDCYLTKCTDTAAAAKIPIAYDSATINQDTATSAIKTPPVSGPITSQTSVTSIPNTSQTSVTSQTCNTVANGQDYYDPNPLQALGDIASIGITTVILVIGVICCLLSAVVTGISYSSSGGTSAITIVLSILMVLSILSIAFNAYQISSTKQSLANRIKKGRPCLKDGKLIN